MFLHKFLEDKVLQDDQDIDIAAKKTIKRRNIRTLEFV